MSSDNSTTALPHREPSVQQTFAQHGLRLTRQRQALYEALCAAHDHPTADELFQEVGHGRQDISLATVYNTLEAFCRAGLAQKLSGKGGSARYDATTSNHLHLRDQRTGAVADAPDSLSDQILQHLPQDLLDRLRKEHGFDVKRIQIELVGEFTG